MRNGLMRNGHKPSSQRIPNDLVSNGSLINNDPGFPPIRRLTADDVGGCCTLSLDRRWWPERDKWALLLDAADGWGIDAPDGQGLAGTVVLTRWGSDCAAIGMMITATRYGGQGLGRALMQHALDAAGAGTAVSLYATGPGRPLYEKLGFKPVRRSIAFRGQFRAQLAGARQRQE